MNWTAGSPSDGIWTWFGQAVSSLAQWFGANWRGRGLSTMTTAAFMERLGSHPVGDHIVSRANQVPGGVTPADISPEPSETLPDPAEPQTDSTDSK